MPGVSLRRGHDLGYHFLRLKVLITKEAVGNRGMHPRKVFALFEDENSGIATFHSFHAGLLELGISLDRKESDELLRKHFGAAESGRQEIKFEEFASALGLNSDDNRETEARTSARSNSDTNSTTAKKEILDNQEAEEIEQEEYEKLKERARKRLRMRKAKKEKKASDRKMARRLRKKNSKNEGVGDEEEEEEEEVEDEEEEDEETAKKREKNRILQRKLAADASKKKREEQQLLYTKAIQVDGDGHSRRKRTMKAEGEEHVEREDSKGKARHLFPRARKHT